MNELERLAYGIQQAEGFHPGSRSWRNHNPGNLRYSPYMSHEDDGFAVFSSYASGWLALIGDLAHKCLGRSSSGLTPESTIMDLAHVWAPASDDNIPETWADNVCIHGHFTPTTKLKEILHA